MKLLSRFNLLRYSVVVLGAIFVYAALGGAHHSASAQAVSATSYDYGHIISDNIFYNKDAMNVSQIQAFLDRLIPNCDTWGTGPSEYGGGTRAQFAASRGWHGPPYACLNNYHENPSNGETSFERGGGAFPGGISAAQIIYNAAQQYGINPQALLVLLKKESAGPLTADNWPLKSQYKYAMGYGCPDSGPGYSPNCDSQKAGFYKQMMLAAWQLKYYKDHPNDYRYRIGWNDIQYNPDPACGTRRVYIENIATLSLYIYTPYVPNAGALANYPGTAHCGAYGNRNFFMFFNEWFGSTRFFVSFTEMDSPRWLRVPAAMYKQDLYTGERVGFELWQDLDIKFTSKAYVNGTLYVRTAYDTERNNIYGIPFSKLAEIRPKSIPPYYAKVTKTTSKTDPLFESGNGSTITSESIISLHQSMKVNNVDYYRMKTDYNNPKGWIASDVLDVGPFITFDKPRYMNTKELISKTNINDGSVGTLYQKNQQLFFDAKVYKDGVSYYRTSQDTSQSSSYAIPADSLEEVSFTPINPKWLTVGSNTQKYFIDTSLLEGTQVNTGRILRITGQAIVNDRTFLQTEFDSTKSNLVGIPASSFSGVSYVRMDRPRTLVLKSPSAKLNPFTLTEWSRVFAVGTKISFNQKTVINNRLYLRSSYDTTYGNASVIPYDILEEL